MTIPMLTAIWAEGALLYASLPAFPAAAPGLTGAWGTTLLQLGWPAEWDALDRRLFTAIHTRGGGWMDTVMLTLRNALTWIPLYAFMLYWFFTRMRAQFWPVVIGTLLVFALTDHTSAAILKPYFARLRPCHDESLQPLIRNLLGCGGAFGMPSSHAANHFGMASFWFAAIAWQHGQRWWWLWVWALLIGLAQVYVGKHYPGDILGGALLGGTAGVLGFTALRYGWPVHGKTRTRKPAA